MSSITIPINLELTPQSRALIDAIVNASPQAPSERTGTITPPAIGQYWPGQGGIYCGVLPAVGDQPAVHMVFSTEEAKLTWGPYGETVEGASSRSNGRGNTRAILLSVSTGKSNYCEAQAEIKNSSKYPAAKWAAEYTNDGHTDFHLPSQAELFMASLHAPQVFNKDGWYWSSTQISAFNAFVQDFEHGNSSWGDKVIECRVRAVRRIPL